MLVNRLLGPFGLVFCIIATSSSAQERDWDAFIYQQFAGMAATTTAEAKAAPQLGPPHRMSRNLTLLLVMARQHWEELSVQTRQLITPWLQRPTDRDGPEKPAWRYTREEATPIDRAHFRVHYVDIDVQGNEDYQNAATTLFAQNVADELEYVWEKQHNNLGYALVPSDLDSANNGDDGRYDVYLTNIGAYSYFGYVAREGRANDPDYPDGAYSYMVLDNDYTDPIFGYDDPTDPLKVTVAHEYFHAVQFGYSYLEDPAFMEQSATWMEDILYPDIHDNYAYIGEPYNDDNNDGQYTEAETFVDRNGNGKRESGSLDYPEYSLDRFVVPKEQLPLLQYGRFLWVRYLSERFGDNIVREIWEGSAESLGGDTFRVMERTLNRHGFTLARAYQEYASWSYGKDKFSDGVNYPLVWVDKTIDTQSLGPNNKVLVDSQSSDSLILQTQFRESANARQMHLSTVYTQILNPSGDYRFTGTGGRVALTMLVSYDGTTKLDHEIIELSRVVGWDTGADGSLEDSGWWSAPAGALRVIAVVSNVSATKNDVVWRLESATRQSVTNDMGGGCTINGGGPFDPILMLLLFGSMWHLVRKSRC